MSRGLGAIQRTALRILRDGHWHTTTDLAAQIYGYRPCIAVTATPTRSQMVSALRALSGLVEAGLAYCVPGKPSRWTANRDRHLADKLRRGHYQASDVLRIRRGRRLLRRAQEQEYRPMANRQAE